MHNLSFRRHIYYNKSIAINIVRAHMYNVKCNYNVNFYLTNTRVFYQSWKEFCTTNSLQEG